MSKLKPDPAREILNEITCEIIASVRADGLKSISTGDSESILRFFRGLAVVKRLTEEDKL